MNNLKLKRIYNLYLRNQIESIFHLLFYFKGIFVSNLYLSLRIVSFRLIIILLDKHMQVLQLVADMVNPLLDAVDHSFK
jgi:hypothetical protein